MQDKEELTSQVDVENMLNREGFTKDFRVTDDCRLCSIGDEKTYEPQEVKIVNFYRFEGESDPDDMSILYALECPMPTLMLLSCRCRIWAKTSINAEAIKEGNRIKKQLKRPNRFFSAVFCVPGIRALG
jgi:hypothetical protein